MLLFKKPFHAGLTSGAITLTFRRWQKPHVRVGGRYRCHPIGVLEVDRVDRVSAGALTPADATRAGFASVAALRSYLEELGPLADTDELWRVELHHGGDGDRVELALEDALTPADIDTIRTKLARLDRDAAWTADTLAIIERQPRIAASKLAAQLGRETLPFKTDVRRLKRLGLTQSFEVGYEISPRGRAFLAATRSMQRTSTRSATTQQKRSAGTRAARNPTQQKRSAGTRAATNATKQKGSVGTRATTNATKQTGSAGTRATTNATKQKGSAGTRTTTNATKPLRRKRESGARGSTRSR